MKISRCWLMIFCIAAISFGSQKQLAFFQWNKTFSLRVLDSGDTLSIGAITADSLHIYIYDCAAGAIVTCDTAGKIASKISLESIGRGSYAGDDFIALDTAFVFLNTVDHRLELFDRLTGRHIGALEYPWNLFKKEPDRIRQSINRIFCDNGRIVLGNSYRLLYLDEAQALTKSSTTVQSLFPPAQEQFVAFDGMRRITQAGKQLKDNGIARWTSIETHYSPTGKRYALGGDRLYGVALDKQGVRLIVWRK